MIPDQHGEMLSWSCFEQKDKAGVLKILDGTFESSMGDVGKVEIKGKSARQTVAGLSREERSPPPTLEQCSS